MKRYSDHLHSEMHTLSCTMCDLYPIINRHRVVDTGYRVTNKAYSFSEAAFPAIISYQSNQLNKD